MNMTLVNHMAIREVLWNRLFVAALQDAENNIMDLI